VLCCLQHYQQTRALALPYFEEVSCCRRRQLVETSCCALPSLITPSPLSSLLSCNSSKGAYRWTSKHEPTYLCVALCILEQVQQELARLLGPPPLPVALAHVLGLRRPPDASAEPPEGDHLLVGDNILQIGLGPDQGHVLDGLG
jgi:hypothetical protein